MPRCHMNECLARILLKNFKVKPIALFISLLLLACITMAPGKMPSVDR